MTFPKPSPPAYSAVQIWLHWGIALLIGSQFVLNGPIGKAWRALSRGQGADISSTVLLHVYVGIGVLVLVLWRLALRVRRGVPDAPESETRAMQMAGHLGHLGLYGLMIFVPISGMMAWYGGIGLAANVHQTATTFVIVLVGLHAAAALYHHFWLKDGLLFRMKMRKTR